MSDKFKLLLKQIHFPQHEEAYNEIKSGSIESVKLFKSKRQWFFVFSFRNLLSYETFTLFDNLLHSSFDSLGAKVSYMINVEDISCDQSLLEAYFSYALDILKSSHFSIYSLFSNLGIEISNNSISVKAPAHILRENLHERFIALIADVLSNVGLSNVSISVLVDKEASSSLEEAYETNKISLQEEAESQARQALQSIVQSSPVPPPQKHQAQNFAEKQSQRVASFDKAEITPMIEVNSEENRIVFEGYIFDVEQRETKTGRIIINFKVTDYTSSFAMQRWVKDSEELVKFGMIKKGNWVRVRGRIENNPFTHSLTMNVQDIKEISHTPRKDLMPEGQKRVEFHAHTNMSTMDAIPTVEELIDTAAFWGHPAVALTYHANVQRFPHGYHKAKKAGIKAGLGIGPSYDVERLRYLLPHIDGLILMSVEPGYGGQPFEESIYEKGKRSVEIMDETGIHVPISIDGGVNTVTGKKLVEAGADILIAGSSVFGADSITDAVKSLKAL